ncbi:MAG: ATP-binding protein [archaeon]
MMLKKEIIDIVLDQKNALKNIDLGIPRSELKEVELTDSFAYVISGIRRCGKSVFLQQIRSNQKSWAYFNFEDTRLNAFSVADFTKLQEALIEVYGNIDIFFFDEIQNVKKWEIFVRQLLDNKKKVIITGSNASLLSKELGTRLTGRHLRKEMFPFSYNEFLKFTSQKSGEVSFKEYLVAGGFPEFLKYKNEEILQELLNNIIYRDIIVRHHLKESKTIKDLAVYLLSNIGKEYSYNNLKKLFEVGSINTIISYISYFEDSYLLFSINRFDYSIKKQLISQKKIYAIDNGFAKANSLSFSKDEGRMLENLVFINLRNHFESIYYYKDQNLECDFIIKEKEKITYAFQVCLDLSADNKVREINGLKLAMSKFKLNKGTILTLNQEDTIKEKDLVIQIVPVWKWKL